MSPIILEAHDLTKKYRHTLVYPIAGCIREFFRFGFIDGGNFIYQAAKAVLYSLLLNSATFFIAIWIC